MSLVSRSRRRAAALVLVAAFWGCERVRPNDDVPVTGDTPAMNETTPGDAATDGRDAGTDGSMDSSVDVPGGDADAGANDGGDAAPSDGGMDGAQDVARMDAPDDTVSADTVPIFDTAPTDAIVPPVCDMDGSSAGAICTSDAMCDPATQRCVPTGCGTVSRCASVGRPCADNADCLAGAQTCRSGRCVPTGTDCGDTRGCPLGFNCEGAAGSRRCVDRRRPCTDGSECDFGSTCYAAAGVAPFCVVAVTRCATDTACILSTRCRDIDGDGMRECVPDGPCGPGRCMGAFNNCEVLPLEFLSVCGAHGICSTTQPCATGYTCVDAWGTGVGECRANATPCRAHADCPAARSLCYDVPPPGSSTPGCH